MYIVNKYTFKFTIHTSPSRGSGTNANVYVQLFGCDGSSTEKHFLCPDRLDRRSKFESGQADAFVVELKNVGKMEKLRIGHDDSGFKSGWHLEKVVVRTMISEAESEETEFVANRWLASDEGNVNKE